VVSFGKRALEKLDFPWSQRREGGRLGDGSGEVGWRGADGLLPRGFEHHDPGDHFGVKGEG